MKLCFEHDVTNLASAVLQPLPTKKCSSLFMFERRETTKLVYMHSLNGSGKSKQKSKRKERFGDFHDCCSGKGGVGVGRKGNGGGEI